MRIKTIADIVEENGKTVRQNNMERTHNIQLGALVEISYDDSYEEECDRVTGLRL